MVSPLEWITLHNKLDIEDRNIYRMTLLQMKTRKVGRTSDSNHLIMVFGFKLSQDLKQSKCYCWRELFFFKKLSHAEIFLETLILL